MKLYNTFKSLSRENIELDKDFSLGYKGLIMKMLTTNEAAHQLGVTVQRVHQFIKDERLPAQKMGRDYLIQEDDLKLVADRKPGRPPNPTPANGAKPKTAKKSGEMPGPKLKAKLRKQARRDK